MNIGEIIRTRRQELGLTLENIGEMSAFFMLAAVFSSYLFSVDPFTQPGVEEYKDEVKKKLDNDN